MNVFVFDIETVPDVESGRVIYDLNDLNDHDTAEAMFTLRREKTGSDFLPHHLQKIVAISVTLRSADKFMVWSLGDEHADEAEILERFYHGIDKYTPTIISWNGGGFDLPVIHYRALKHGIAAPRYWEVGETDQQFKWNNYLNRFHYRHLDLMDVLAGYQTRANAPLDQVASMLGFPGKMGMDGSKVWPTYQEGNIKAIRDYCETDVLNTFLVYLRFELIRGNLSETQYQEQCEVVRHYLAESDQAHLQEFLQAWQ